jgi:hypothetical protein
MNRDVALGNNEALFIYILKIKLYLLNHDPDGMTVSGKEREKTG